MSYYQSVRLLAACRALVTGAASIGRPGATLVAASNVNVNVCPTAVVFWGVGLLATCRMRVAGAASIGHPGSTLVATSRTL